jgi:predicted MFS family arabinose efflux permease
MPKSGKATEPRDADRVERRLLWVVAAVQFVNVLDFMMVMPLGPDFADGLGIDVSRLGLVGGAYTAAAAVTGLIGATFLDRFDRRRALGVALLGLVVGTAMGGLATGLPSLLAARVLAGAFGGPATAISLSIVADLVPPERRGRALGLVMGAFSVASVLGVPAGLELARVGGWQLPFFAVALLGLAITAMAMFMLPAMRSHLEAEAPAAPGAVPALSLMQEPAVRTSLLASGLVMLANFAIIPNLSAYIQFNGGYPRERLGLLYLVGGAASFFTLRLAGIAVDRFGAPVVALVGTAFYAVVVLLTLGADVPLLPMLPLFVGFMVTGSLRMVPMQTLASRVPMPRARARFMSIQSAVQHIASATGAASSTLFLVSLPDGRLVGMSTLALGAVGLASTLPLLLWLTERRLKQRDGGGAPGLGHTPAASPLRPP